MITEHILRRDHVTVFLTLDEKHRPLLREAGGEDSSKFSLFVP
jgi:hypothetical protein